MGESLLSANRRIFLLSGILGSVLSSIAWVTEQESVVRLSPLTVASVAPLLAGIAMAPFALRYHRIPSKEVLRRYAKQFIAVMLVRNIFGILIFTSALLMTSSAKVMFLTKVEPYIVLFIHWVFYHERIPGRDLLLLLVHVFGAIILSTGGTFNFQIEQIGDVLVLLGILGNALMYRPGKQLAEEWGSGFTNTVGSFLTGVLLLPFALLWHFEDFALDPVRMTGFLWLLVTVLIFYIISSTLWYYSLKGMEPWLSSALRCIGPVVAAPIAWMYFDKPLGLTQLLGATIVVLTSMLLVRSSGRPAPGTSSSTA